MRCRWRVRESDDAAMAPLRYCSQRYTARTCRDRRIEFYAWMMRHFRRTQRELFIIIIGEAAPRQHAEHGRIAATVKKGAWPISRYFPLIYKIPACSAHTYDAFSRASIYLELLRDNIIFRHCRLLGLPGSSLIYFCQMWRQIFLFNYRPGFRQK